ncbi:MAG: 5'-methylthioadenosine/adenosylhomocysteine nucleosidase [Oscillospiraceae bacterium]|jgi:adenosylhomocysteine nucleosidase|nr:5'-methylthioadenosine/adenosylhomocysteine nucleosidase [Oscillospiraceae bacterium]
MIGIIAALNIEISLLRQNLEGDETRLIAGNLYSKGTLCGQNVVLAVCGVGKVNAAVCAQTMCLEYDAEMIINTGVAGALSPELGVGDVVIADCAVQHDMDTTAIGDEPGTLSIAGESIVRLPCYRETALSLLGQAQKLGANAVLGTIASGDQFIHNPERKEFLRGTFNAACCEMEGAAIAHVCALNETACAIVRVISDSADGGAPVDFALFAPKAAKLGAEIVQNFLADE